MSDNEEQTMQDGNHATDDDKLQGILGQVRADASLGNEGDLRTLLEQRLHDAGITLSTEQFDAALAEVSAA
jgi:hypothetical protein